MKRYTLPDWVSHHTETWSRWLAPFRGQPVTGVEIGSCEFRAGQWFMENILTDPDSLLICIDPWVKEWYGGSCPTRRYKPVGYAGANQINRRPRRPIRQSSPRQSAGHRADRLAAQLRNTGRATAVRHWPGTPYNKYRWLLPIRVANGKSTVDAMKTPKPRFTRQPHRQPDAAPA